MAVLLAPAVASASPQDLFGYGVRMPGTGMTGPAYADDYEAVYANPAGLARARKKKIAVGLQAGAFHAELDGQRLPVDAGRGMTIGFQLPIPFGGVLEDRFVVGAGFYTPSSVLMKADIRFPDVPQFPVLSRTPIVAIQVGLGLDLHGLVDGLRLGVAFSVLANTVGDLDVFLDETNTFRSTTETELIADFSPIVGASYDIGDFSVGVVYRQRARAINRLRINTAGLPVELPQLNVEGVVQYDPPTVAAELAWRPTPDWLLAAGVEVSLWNDWPGIQARTSSGSNLAPDPDFRATVSPRVGLERRFAREDTEVWLRGGYAFEPTPAPESRVAPNRPADPATEPDPVALRYYDNHRHLWTAGLGLAAPIGGGKRVRFDVFGQLHWMMPRTHGIPADGSAGDLDGSEPPAKTSGFALAGGWTVGLEF